MSYRIAVGGIKHETNGLANYFTQLRDFIVRREREVIPKFLEECFPQVDFKPTLLARALPGGLVTREAYEILRNELLAKLEASLPVDGIFLDLHGAMKVQGIENGEVNLLKEIREIVGWEVPIAVSLDLHGNLAPEIIELADIITAFRTAPHIDWEETCLRAVMLLIKSIKHNIKIRRALVKVPLLLPGEKAVTTIEPAKSLYRKLVEYEALDKVLDVSLLIGCVWSDSPYSSVTTLALTNNDKELACKIAKELALEVWEKRDKFTFETEALPFEDALDKAIKLKGKPVFISDSGDNVTAGGSGDVNICLKRILEKNVNERILIAGIYDNEATLKCFTEGKGIEIRLSLGGKIDREHSEPLDVTCKILENRITSDGTKVSLVRINEKIDVIITSRRKAFSSLRSLYEAGIDPKDYKVIVVKLGYLFPSLRTIAYHYYLALTPGYTDLVIERLPFKNVKRPIYPLDKDLRWEPNVVYTR